MAIQKPEWFKVDPAKFLSDAQVDAMSTLELGACFRLLCRQWLDGYIPDNPRVLARLCRLDATAMDEAWVTLERFFPTIEPGRRANRFMWISREKVIADLERRSDEGTRAARKRWNEARKSPTDATPNGSPMPDLMQEQTRPEQTRPEKPSLSEQGCSDVEIAPSKKLRLEPSMEAIRLASLLKAEILRNRCDFTTTQAQDRNWVASADRMLRIDKRNPEEAAELIQWAQRDEFWKGNILSMDKFREKFVQLALKAEVKTTSKIAAPVPLPTNYVPASEQIRREREQQRQAAVPQ